MAITINKIDAVEYHRNGVCGVGFYVCDFTWSDQWNEQVDARGIVFDSDQEVPEYYAITTNDPSEKWRGDHFIDLIWPAIRDKMDERWDRMIAAHKAGV